MDIAVIDQRRYGRQTRYYVLRQGARSDDFLPEPSLEYWREVKREDFVSASIAAYLERSKQ